MSAGRAPGSDPASAPSSSSSSCVKDLHILYPWVSGESKEQACPALLPPPCVTSVLRSLELGTSCQRVSGEVPPGFQAAIPAHPQRNLLCHCCRVKPGTSSMCGASNILQHLLHKRRAGFLFLEIIMAMIELLLNQLLQKHRSHLL